MNPLYPSSNGSPASYNITLPPLPAYSVNGTQHAVNIRLMGSPPRLWLQNAAASMPSAASLPVPANAGRKAMNAKLNNYSPVVAPLIPEERRMKANELDLLKKSAARLMATYKQTEEVFGKNAAKPMRIELLKNKKRIDELVAELSAKGGSRRKIHKLRKTRKNMRHRK